GRENEICSIAFADGLERRARALSRSPSGYLRDGGLIKREEMIAEGEGTVLQCCAVAARWTSPRRLFGGGGRRALRDAGCHSRRPFDAARHGPNGCGRRCRCRATQPDRDLQRDTDANAAIATHHFTHSMILS